MHTDSSTIALNAAIPVRKGIVALSGYGLSVCVERGRLCLRDGIAAQRRESRFSKATSGITRLAILGHSGVITLEALRWLRDVKAAVIQVDADGNVILASAPRGRTYGSLRRAQAVAYGTETGLQIARRLLDQKLTGEASVTELLGAGDEAKTITALGKSLASATNTDQLRLIESRAAAFYWSAWSGVPLNFARRDASRVPDYWLTFGSRGSPLTDSPRNAVNPANALLNYLYAILEAETRIALLIVGLDPALGVLHTDLPSRDSLVYDVMEAIRPQVDAWLLDFIRQTKFSARHFFERRDGSLRLTSGLAKVLAETSPVWEKAVGPVAEWVADELFRSTKGRAAESRSVSSGALPTPLTERNRSAGRQRLLGRKPKRRADTGPKQPKTCVECGALLTNRKRRFCSKKCWNAYNTAIVLPKLADAGLGELAKQRAEGDDHSHGDEAARKRGQMLLRRTKERLEWEALHGDGAAEKQRFKDSFLPRLANFSLRQICHATGLSLRYASLIRRGLYVPHPMHYEALRKLIDSALQATGARSSV